MPARNRKFRKAAVRNKKCSIADLVPQVTKRCLEKEILETRGKVSYNACVDRQGALESEK